MTDADHARAALYAALRRLQHAIDTGRIRADSEAHHRYQRIVLRQLRAAVTAART